MEAEEEASDEEEEEDKVNRGGGEVKGGSQESFWDEVAEKKSLFVRQSKFCSLSPLMWTVKQVHWMTAEPLQLTGFVSSN